MTEFRDQVFHFGGVPVGSGMLPPTGFGGKSIFVHGSSGVDSGSGENIRRPLKTLTYAYSKLVDGRGDVVYILNDGSTSASVRDAALVWAKDNCHIVGLGAPSINQRVRIAPPTSDTEDVDGYTPYLTLSASGCIISNVSWFQGQTEDTKTSVGIKVSGSRNYLSNVSIITGAHANQGDEVCYNLQVTGSENVFDGCYIGQDTAARSNVASANVRFGSGASDEATRNIFRNCVFPMFADGAGPIFIAATTAFDTSRWNLFKNCDFINTGTSTITQGVSWADTTGKLFLHDCSFFGLTDITTGNNAYVKISGFALGSTNDIGMYGTATTS